MTTDDFPTDVLTAEQQRQRAEAICDRLMAQVNGGR